MQTRAEDQTVDGPPVLPPAGDDAPDPHGRGDVLVRLGDAPPALAARWQRDLDALVAER